MNWRLRTISTLLALVVIATGCTADDTTTAPAGQADSSSEQDQQPEGSAPERVADARFEPLASLDGYEVAGSLRSDVSLLPSVFVGDQMSLDAFTAAMSDSSIRLGGVDVSTEVLIATNVTSCMPIDLFLEEADEVLTVVDIDSGYDCEVPQENFVVFDVPRTVLDRVNLNADGSPVLFRQGRSEGTGPTEARRVEAAAYATPDQLAEFARDLADPVAIFNGVLVAENLDDSVSQLPAWVVVEEEHFEQFELAIANAEFDTEFDIDIADDLIDDGGFDLREAERDGSLVIAANVTACMPHSITLDRGGPHALITVKKSGILCEQPYEFVAVFVVWLEDATNLRIDDDTVVIVKYEYFNELEPSHSVVLVPDWACANQVDC